MDFIYVYILLILKHTLPVISAQHNNNIDDKELLEKFYADLNNEWLGILLPRYTLLLLGVCMKYLKNEEDAKDCVQEIFLKVIKELHKYKVSYFKSWVYMIAKNHCLMKLRDKSKYPVEIKEEMMPADVSTEVVNERIEKENSLVQMQTALLQLNKEQQQCVILFYLEKKSYQEIAAQTNYSMMQVKSYIQNGKRNLNHLLQQKIIEQK